MGTLRGSSVGQTIAAALALLLALAGIGRGLMAAPDAPVVMIAGVVAPICHAQMGGGGTPPEGGGAPIRHDCCDECALSAPATLPAAPATSVPARLVLAERLGIATGSIPALAHRRTPRQSQGPPAA